MRWEIRLPSESWMSARTRGKYRLMTHHFPEKYNTNSAISGPPSDSKAKPDDSHKGEGILKSAWHKLMNASKGCESENQPGEQNKKESSESKNEEPKDQETKEEEQKKSSSGSN